MKKCKTIPVGTMVRVGHNLELTDRHWTTTPEMEEMKGGIFKVSRSNSRMVYLDEFYFDPRDVSIINPEKTKKDKQEFHFDPKELIT